MAVFLRELQKNSEGRVLTATVQIDRRDYELIAEALESEAILCGKYSAPDRALGHFLERDFIGQMRRREHAATRLVRDLRAAFDGFPPDFAPPPAPED